MNFIGGLVESWTSFLAKINCKTWPAEKTDQILCREPQTVLLSPFSGTRAGIVQFVDPSGSLEK